MAGLPVLKGGSMDTPQRTDSFWDQLRLRFKREPKPIRNANEIQEASLSKLDQLAIKITDKVGSIGFFLIILTWTICWTGYNIIATEFKGLGLPAFDPFPAFVAYLLISNVIQILLMPLIMVGQNLQNRHSETRAELDFETNKKAEQEVVFILKHLEHNTDLIVQLMKHLDVKISKTEMEQLTEVRRAADAVAAKPIGDDPAE